MDGALLEVKQLTKRFGGFVALDRISVEIRRGERFGLIGPNGSGKTTLINCISGALVGDGGRILFRGDDVTRWPAHRRTRSGIARSFQIPKPFRSMTSAGIQKRQPAIGHRPNSPDGRTARTSRRMPNATAGAQDGP